MPIKISVPATSANLGPGYDVWGIALSLRNEFTGTIKESHLASSSLCTFDFKFSPFVQETMGGSPPSIPQDDTNLISRAYRYIFEKAGQKPVPVHIECQMNIPPERGLGASSTAILAGMVLANEVLRDTRKEAYSIEQLFDFATDIEGHPDNIAPALYGGWVLSIWDEATAKYKPFNLTINAPVKLVGVTPHLSLNTEKARSVVASSFSIDVLIAQSSRTALLTHLLSLPKFSEYDAENFALALDDRIHQPQRAPLIPGMFETFDYWRSLGCYGAFLSGAGTTLLGFWDKQTNASNLQLSTVLQQHKVNSTLLELDIDYGGLIVEKSSN